MRPLQAAARIVHSRRDFPAKFGAGGGRAAAGVCTVLLGAGGFARAASALLRPLAASVLRGAGRALPRLGAGFIHRRAVGAQAPASARVARPCPWAARSCRRTRFDWPAASTSHPGSVRRSALSSRRGWPAASIVSPLVGSAFGAFISLRLACGLDVSPLVGSAFGVFISPRFASGLDVSPLVDVWPLVG